MVLRPAWDSIDHVDQLADYVLSIPATARSITRLRVTGLATSEDRTARYELLGTREDKLLHWSLTARPLPAPSGVENAGHDEFKRFISEWALLQHYDFPRFVIDVDRAISVIWKPYAWPTRPPRATKHWQRTTSPFLPRNDRPSLPYGHKSRCSADIRYAPFKPWEYHGPDDILRYQVRATTTIDIPFYDEERRSEDRYRHRGMTQLPTLAERINNIFPLLPPLTQPEVSIAYEHAHRRQRDKSSA